MLTYKVDGDQLITDQPSHPREERTKVEFQGKDLILDFQGDLTLDMVRDFLREDDSREGRALLAKLVEDRGVSDMMITLADCLQDYLKTGINDETLREQIRTYAES